MLEFKAVLIIVTGMMLVLLGLCCKEKRIVHPVSYTWNKKLDVTYFTIFFMFWLFAISVSESYDIANYRYAYNGRISHGKEVVFDLIRFFFYDHGWSFDAFKILWVTIVILLLYIAIKKYSNSPCAVVALALVTPLIGFITQMRSALVGAIFLNAFHLLVQGGRKNRIAYAALIILSAQIHIIGYGFLIFLFINPESNRTFKPLYYFFIGVATLIALFSTGSFSQVIYSILDHLPVAGKGLARVLEYFQGEGSSFKYAFFLLLKHQFFFSLTDRACEVRMMELDVSDFDIRKYRMIREANVLMLMFLPITMVSASFERMFNCFVLIQYAMIFNAGRSKVLLFKKISWQQSIQSLMILMVFFMFTVECYYSSSDLITILNSVRWPF